MPVRGGYEGSSLSCPARREPARCHGMEHEGGAAVREEPGRPDRSGGDEAAPEPDRPVSGDVRRDAYPMDHPRRLGGGGQVGSGSMGSACEAVACRRSCGAGMRWGGDGADSARHLRALMRSEKGRWEAFASRSIS